MLGVFRTERSPLQQEIGRRSMSPHTILAIKAIPIKAHIRSWLWIKICIKLHYRSASQSPHKWANFNKLLPKPFLTVPWLPQFKGRASSWGCNTKGWATAAAPGLDPGGEVWKPLYSLSRDSACTGATAQLHVDHPGWPPLHAAGTWATLLKLLPPSAVFQRAVPAHNVWWELDLWLADIWLGARQWGDWNYWSPTIIPVHNNILCSSACRQKETELDKTSILTMGIMQ